MKPLLCPNFLHSTFDTRFHRSLSFGALLLGLATTAQAQPTIMTPPIGSTSSVAAPPVSTPADATVKTIAVKTVIADPNAIAININGRNIATDPAPILQRGSVLVPLRGVLENFGAKVTYDAVTSRIDILQNKKRYSLKAGETSVAVENSVITLAASIRR